MAAQFNQTASGLFIPLAQSPVANIKPTVIGPDEHVFIDGMTGTGKTWAARKLHANDPHVVVLDTKGTFGGEKGIWPEVPRSQQILVRSLDELGRINPKRYRVIIYRPKLQELNQDAYERFFMWVYLRGHCRVIVDELMEVCPNPFRYPLYLKGIWTRGRELGVTATCCTQRPTGVPVLAMSEAVHTISYNLRMPQDRMKMAEVTGCPELLRNPGKFQAWYYRMGEEHPVKIRFREERG